MLVTNLAIFVTNITSFISLEFTSRITSQFQIYFTFEKSLYFEFHFLRLHYFVRVTSLALREQSNFTVGFMTTCQTMQQDLAFVAQIKQIPRSTQSFFWSPLFIFPARIIVYITKVSLSKWAMTLKNFWSGKFNILSLLSHFKLWVRIWHFEVSQIRFYLFNFLFWGRMFE